MPAADLSAAQARRIAIAAQGFGVRRPRGEPGRPWLRRVLRHTALFQIDSVNVLVRAHYLPAFSRIGPYERTVLDRMAQRAPRELFEYWGHMASLLPVETQPLFRWRMERARGEAWGRIRRIIDERPGFVDWVLGEVRDRGPLGAGKLLQGRLPRTGSWWQWDDAKLALEWLFWSGQVTSAGRRGFERLYDLPERVLPPAVVAAPTPAPADARRELVRIAGRSLGIGTEADLRDYFRLGVADSRPAIADLVEAGELRRVTVEGWRQPAYLQRDARVGRPIDARALLVPFDPLVWERSRTERLFGMRYRIEIYVPAAQRVHGYYVLPFLMNEQLVARVDLKADRVAGALLVQAAHLEPGANAATVVEGLAVELRRLAGWLGLSELVLAPRGDLSAALAGALVPEGALLSAVE
ncbi:MAG: crosslink repair DNA glycosylase YcaQ family protein [Candidatus Dormiibacterota bacterium]